MLTNEEKFRMGTVLYVDGGGDYHLELWGASTKHPDTHFRFQNFDKCWYVDDEHQVFQWICECASKLSFPSNAVRLVEWALENVHPAKVDEWLPKIPKEF